MTKLHPPLFVPFATGAITPTGWLADQLRTQAASLSGHLDLFWPDIADSRWIGGDAEGWERLPYWLDGVIPLAWLLDDGALKARITGYIDYIIEHQRTDGGLGPATADEPRAADQWSLALALKVLVAWHEATGDARVEAVVERALRGLDQVVDPFALNRWGQFRWFEFLVSIWWLHDRTGEPWLIDLAVKLRAQGFDWVDFFRRWPLTAPTGRGKWTFAGHVVNNAMALKQGALWWRLTGEDADRLAPEAMIAQLDRWHGMPTGVFSGDECLAGTSATQGTELCAVVEYMYSLEWLVRISGERAFADRLEQIAFNALPATFSPDMWCHQYDQQLNQVECSVRENRPWNSNGPDANIFGLEPNFGCCTANLSQGWPKLAAYQWLRTADDGVAVATYAPSTLETTIRGTRVTIELVTDYPFRDQLRISVCAAAPVEFPLRLRVPGWVGTRGTLELDGTRSALAASDGYHTLARRWQGETQLHLRLPMQAEWLPRPGGAVSLRRGPLLYALAPGEEWRRINEEQPWRKEAHGDWEVYPTTPWNYALRREDDSPEVAEHPLASPVYTPHHPPVTLALTGRRVPAWTEEQGSAGPTPQSPVATAEPLEELRLIPYGCTNLRIAEFPVVAE